MARIIWKDTKTFCGFPICFTEYCFTDQMLIIKSGFIATKRQQIPYYKITDVTIIQTLGNKVFRVGSVICHTSDKSIGTVSLQNIKNFEIANDLIPELIQRSRAQYNVRSSELLDDS